MGKTRIYVDTDFKKMLQKEAIEKDMSVQKFTKMLHKEAMYCNSTIEGYFKRKPNEKKKFEFKF